MRNWLGFICFGVLSIAALDRGSAQTSNSDLSERHKIALSVVGRSSVQASPNATPPQRLGTPILSGEIAGGPDILGGKERIDSQLAQMAIYSDLGNRDAVEISLSFARRFGLTRDELQDFIDRAKLHSGPVLGFPAETVR